MGCVVYCEQCDMEREFCQHGLDDKRPRAATGELLISPNGMAHLPGCPHKGDDPDFSGWAELNLPDAWQRLGNGEQLQATGGQRLDLVAKSRCRDCVSHGAW